MDIEALSKGVGLFKSAITALRQVVDMLPDSGKKKEAIADCKNKNKCNRNKKARNKVQCDGDGKNKSKSICKKNIKHQSNES